MKTDDRVPAVPLPNPSCIRILDSKVYEKSLVEFVGGNQACFSREWMLLVKTRNPLAS